VNKIRLKSGKELEKPSVDGVDKRRLEPGKELEDQVWMV
jgi:hypothetical protein